MVTPGARWASVASLPMALPQPPTVPHCYRHPDREAGRSCTRCGRPACSDCLVQATVGSHCLECAKAARPDVRTRVKYANARLLTPATLALVAINVAVFVWMAAADTNSLSGNVTQLHIDLGLNKGVLQGLYAPAIPGHEWYRLVTSGFVHFGIFHIAMNMLLLYQLGLLLEKAFGPGKLLAMYGASLLAGSFGVLLVDTPGLDLIAGDTIPVPPEAADGRPHRVPHTGWNAVRPDRHGAWDGTALADVATGSAFYFVHAFHFVPRGPARRLAVADYGGRELTAAAGRGAILGCQFHPEKSGPTGLGIFRRFMAL